MSKKAVLKNAAKERGINLNNLWGDIDDPFQSTGQSEQGLALMTDNCGTINIQTPWGTAPALQGVSEHTNRMYCLKKLLQAIKIEFRGSFNEATLRPKNNVYCPFFR